MKLPTTGLDVKSKGIIRMRRIVKFSLRETERWWYHFRSWGG